MAQTISIPTVTSSTSKKEEIDVLKKIALCFDGNSYLGSFFSAEAVEWATHQITDDAPPDLYGWFSASEARVRVLESIVADSNAANTVLNDKLTAELNASAQREARKDQKIAELEQYKQALINDAANLGDSLEQAEHEIDRLQKLVVALKVEVYDLTHR